MQNMLKYAPFALMLALAAAILWRWQDVPWPAFVWLAGVIAINIIRAPFAMSTAQNTIVEDQKTAQERVLLFAMALTGGIVPLLHLATGWFGFADYALPDWAAYVGVIVLAFSLWVFWRSHVDLGKNWSVSLEMREGHTLVTEGIYRRIRHPMYAAIWLMVLAQPLLVQNWIAGPPVLLAFAAMYMLRVPQEEAMMRARFGDEYDRYIERSGRIWPARAG